MHMTEMMPGEDVAFRTNLAVSDLHAADARYRRDCIAKIFTNRPSESSAETCDCALDKLVTQMLSDCSHIWNSVELHACTKSRVEHCSHDVHLSSL